MKIISNYFIHNQFFLKVKALYGEQNYSSWQSQSFSARNFFWALYVKKAYSSWQSQSFSARNFFWALPSKKETV